MERSRQFKAKLNDLTLSHMDERSENFDVSLFGPGANELLKCLIVSGTTVRVARAILLDGADDDLLRAEDLGPADGGGQKMGVAEGHVGDGNRLPNRFGGWSVGHGDIDVRECGTADLAKDVDPEGKKLGEIEGFSNGAGAFELAALGALAVTEVEGVGLVVAGGKGGADGGVHAPGETENGARTGGAGAGNRSGRN